MGNNESDKKVMWYEVYHELAKLLVQVEPEKFYEKCMNDDEFKKEHNWTNVLEEKKHWIKNTFDGRVKWGHYHDKGTEDEEYPIESFDPMQIFASFNGFGMKEESRIRKINIYFRLLGSEKRYSEEEKEIRLFEKLKSFKWSILEKKLSLKDFNYQWIEFCRKSIDFIGCPSPMMLALVLMRHPDEVKILWKAFRNAMKFKEEDKIDFEEIKKCHGVSVEIFTVLLFWIDSRNFLPLDKNTLALFETNNDKNKEIKYDTWEEYITFLTEENRPRPTDTYRVIARMAWKCTNELSKYALQLKQFGITKCPNKSLKIIAIKPLDDCNEKFLKGLKKNEVYLFDKAYNIDKDGSIEYHKEKDIQLFNQKNLDININAIVGKNGTGKSTLIELLLAVINNVNCINNQSEIDSEYNNKIKKNKEFKKKENGISFIDNLQVEFIFEDLHIYKIQINNENVQLFEYQNEKKEWKEIKTLHQKQLFYNILVNYSIHSLDSNQNSWIEAHFYSDCDRNNDCYTTNIVIEPFRENGNINIQKEEKNVKNRLIVNLLEPETDDEDEYSFRKLTSTLKADKIFVSKKNKGRFPKYFDEIYKDGYNSTTKTGKYDLEELSKKIHSIKDINESIEKYLISDFIDDIILTNDIKFSQLSSGEKQKIYSINSIVYHIQRLDKKKYKHINLILDEIELYFHPELQRTYINDIIKAIKKVDTSNILGINITFITHSPFILSDIPESKILFLDKESDDVNAKTVPMKTDIKTFGANIHNLLSNGFFMGGKLMGEFAFKKIQGIVDFYNSVKKGNETIETYKLKREEFHAIRDNIGEEYIKGVITNHIEFIEEKLGDKSFKEKRIIELKKELAKLETDNDKD